MTLGPLKKITGRLDCHPHSSSLLLLINCSTLLVNDKHGGQNDCFDGLRSYSLGQNVHKKRVVKDHGLWSHADMGSNPSSTIY